MHGLNLILANFKKLAKKLALYVLGQFSFSMSNRVYL